VIRLVGLGPASVGGMSVAARDALLSGAPVILRTERHPCVEDLRRAGVPFSSCDDLYESSPDFASVYEAIADRVLVASARGDVAFAVPGDPMVGEETVRLILSGAHERRIPVVVVSSPSFIEAVLAAVGQVLDERLVVMDALTAHSAAIPSDAPVLIYQVYDADAASRVKLALLKDRPAEQEVVVVRAAGSPTSAKTDRVPLHRLDRIAPDHLTAVYVPPVAPCQLPLAPRFSDLVQVMRRLRGEGGCPWDQAQTHETLRKWLVEECYEAVDAIDRGDMTALCEELGDVLLQIAFHAQIASESGAFDADDVIAGIVRKLVNRHPHVFGSASAADAAEVERNWEAIKRAEKAGRTSVLDGVPASLPALHRAAELGRRAAAAGFDWERVEDVLAKIEEEMRELRACLGSGAPEEVRHEIGDLLFAVTNLARWADVDPEEALREMLGRFVARFRRIEQAASEAGRDLNDLTLAEMDQIWERAKAEGA